MNSNSEQIITATIAAVRRTDPSITDGCIAAAMSALRNEREVDFTLKISEAAALAGFGIEACRWHIARGDFQKVNVGNTSRCSGVSASSVAKQLGMSVPSLLAALSSEPIQARIRAFNARRTA